MSAALMMSREPAIAFQIDVEDAVGVVSQARKITNEVEDLL